MKFIFEQMQTGGDRNFGYLIGDREVGIGVLVDPSYNPDALVERANAQGLKIEWIINTHGHGDHTNGNDRAQELTGAKVAAWHGSSIHPDVDLEDNQEIGVGSYTLRILHTPGHIEDHIVLYNPDFKIALTGDHLFVGKIGGTLSDENARKQHESLHRLIEELPGETTIWPGHNVGCRPSSTLDLEKATNPFLLAENFEAFKELKATWGALKQKQGLA